MLPQSPTGKRWANGLTFIASAPGAWHWKISPGQAPDGTANCVLLSPAINDCRTGRSVTRQSFEQGG
jgi:hypothetical protein